MTDKEIIELLAELMGWKSFDDCGHIENLPNQCYRENAGKVFYLHHNWNPLENISDAWELVEKLKDTWLFLIQNQPNGNYWVGMHKKDTDMVNIHSEENTAPRAICMAVIKVIENGDESHG